MSKLIWIIDEEWKDYEIEEQLFKREVPDYKVKHSNNQYMKDLEDFGKYAEAILAQIYVDIPGETISKLENCKVISVYGGGFDRVNLDAAKEKGIIVTYVPAYCLEEVSDHVLAFIYYFARKLNSYMEPIKNGLWGRQAVTDMPKRIKGTVLFLVGFGRIARAVARKAKSLGMEVTTYDPYVKDDETEIFGVKKVEWEEGFKFADFVSIHIPLNEETKAMVGRKEFEIMKRHSVLINTSRGELVDENELLNAVRKGKIAGAALDVIASEPPNPDREILNCDRILITPHVAYLSDDSLVELKKRAAENAITALRGLQPKDSI